MRMRVYLCILMGWFLQAIHAQLLPPVYNYAPATYAGESQNWKICQAANQKLYFANNIGLLEFNGVMWQHYPLPNGAIVRAVNAQGNTIYTGGFAEFGYWQADAFNRLQYTSLSKQLSASDIADEEIWKIVFVDHWVLFQSLHKLYIYDSQHKRFHIVHSPNNLPKIFKVGEHLFFQKMNEGLFALVNGKEELRSNAALFREHIVIDIISHKGHYLFITQDKGIYEGTPAEVKPWQVPTEALTSSLNIYSSAPLSDGSILLGTIANGLYRLSREGQLLEHLHQKEGLQNNTVLSIFEDQERNVWLGLDNGISMVNFFSPFRQYKDYEGVLGAVYTSIIYQGDLYLGTNQGLFYAPFPLRAGQQFQLVAGTKGQVWQLKELQGTLFCGHNSGTFVIENHRADLVCNLLGTWDIKPVEAHPDWLLQGNYEGLHILERKDGHWQYRHKIAGFNVSSRFFEWVNAKELLVSHEYKGVFHLKLSDDLTRVTEVRKDPTAPMGRKSGIAKYRDEIWYFTEKGLFKYDANKRQFVQDEPLTRELFDQDAYLSGTMLQGKDDALWLFTQYNIVKVSQGKLDKALQIKKMPLSAAFRKDIVGYENLREYGEVHCLLGTSTGFMDFAFNPSHHNAYEVRMERISNSKVEGEWLPIALGSEVQKFAYNLNNLRFSYSVPAYSAMYPSVYQYKLEGLYEHWSEWSKEAEVQFDNLPAGEYTFLVRAKVGNAVSPNTATFRFVIEKPWYATNLMITLYALSLLLLLLAINRAYRQHYKRHKEKVDKEKEKELALLQLENDRTVMKLHNDKLQSEVESKNRELAATTMNIVRKNELLMSIKEALLSSGNSKQVLHIVEDNINSEGDWEHFQDIFNQTDRDFLNRLKALHPDLTPNDIKLCIYLRLNLSSKEIAPLLNISTQSIEIKRYRLRKKMNLERNQNLTDYILKL
ncbi:hypothetical protein RCZ04_03190 [Capnocytophaga sp. HP1101]